MTNEQKLLKDRLEKYFDDHFDDILADLSEILSIDSSFGTPSDGKPFGNGSAAALAWGAKKGAELGLTVRNFDNYAISMTYGTDEPVLGILSHLDTVPATPDGWSHEPFACTLDDGYIYGRGAIDDKGPSVAVLWAVKALKELNVPLTKSFRIIFGGNEERGCDDIAYYQTKEPFPPRIFSPDGSFPVLNCEKGLIHITFSAPFEDNEIVSIKAGSVLNAIPDFCNVGVREENGVTTKVTKGKPAHGSRPENGENAVTKFLAEYKGANPLLKALRRLFPHGEYDGSSCGLGFSDDVSGTMTCALTLLNTEGGRLTGGIDIRFPIDRTCAEIGGIIKAALSDAGFVTDSFMGKEPHYVPADDPFVQALLQVYEDVKGEPGEPVSEGGITYVHDTPGGVAFGAEFPWEDNHMHGIDERVSVETYKYNLNMYANAIARICG